MASTAFAEGNVPNKTDQALLRGLISSIDEIVDGISDLLSRSAERFDNRGVGAVLNELLEAHDQSTDVIRNNIDAIDDLIHDFSIISGHRNLLSLIYQSLRVLSQRDAMSCNILQGASHALQNQEREGVNQRTDDVTQRRHVER